MEIGRRGDVGQRKWREEQAGVQGQCRVRRWRRVREEAEEKENGIRERGDGEGGQWNRRGDSEIGWVDAGRVV